MSDAFYIADYFDLKRWSVMCQTYERIIKYDEVYRITFETGDIGFIENLILRYNRRGNL